jgi:hypothetical protein
MGSMVMDEMKEDIGNGYGSTLYTRHTDSNEIQKINNVAIHNAIAMYEYLSLQNNKNIIIIIKK